MMHVPFGPANHVVNAADGGLQIVQRALFRPHHTLPVPLIDVQGMEIVQILVGADGVHVGVQTFAGHKIQIGQLHALPFRQRVDDLGAHIRHRLDRKCHRTLDAVEIVVDAGSGLHEQRCGDADEVQFEGQIRLEKRFDLADGAFRLAHIQQTAIIFWNNQTCNHISPFQNSN